MQFAKNKTRRCSSRKTKRDDAVRKNKTRRCSSQKQNAAMQFAKTKRDDAVRKNKTLQCSSQKTERDDVVSRKPNTQCAMQRCSSRKPNATLQFEEQTWRCSWRKPNRDDAVHEIELLCNATSLSSCRFFSWEKQKEGEKGFHEHNGKRMLF